MPKANTAKRSNKPTVVSNEPVTFGPWDTQVQASVAGFISAKEPIKKDGSIIGWKLKLRPAKSPWTNAQGVAQVTMTWIVIEVWGPAAKMLDPDVGAGDWVSASVGFPTTTAWQGKDDEKLYSALVFKTNHPVNIVFSAGEAENTEVPPEDEGDDVPGHPLEDIPG